MENNCIFCKIINGDIPATTIYEDDDFKVILDISPAAKGHAILLPKKHFANLYEMDEKTAAKALPVVQRVATAIKDVFQCDGLNVLQNNGEAAGQSVFHFHIHMIPRYREDPVTITWQQGKYADGEMSSIAASIAAKLQ